MTWKTMKFDNFIKLQRGHDLTAEQIIEGQYPVVSSTSIMGYHNCYKYKAPGVVTGRSGTIGVVQYIEKDYWPHNTTLFVKDFKNNHPKFVYYFLKNYGTGSFKGGAAVPTLNRNTLAILDVNIPDVVTQKKIANILSAYDDLIENNQKQIKLLEEAAQRLYKEWFVDLHFPGYENTKIIDGIPEGWEKTKLSSFITELESGSRPKGGAEKVGVPSIGAENIERFGSYDFSKEKFVNINFFNNMNQGKVYSGDVLLYKDGAYAGKKISLSLNNFPHKNCAINEHVFIIRTLGKQYQFFLYFLMSLESNKEYLYTIACSKTGQPGLSKPNVENMPIILPDKNLISKYNDIISPNMNLIANCANRIKILKEARNLLLPKLMNGEIEV